jgi:hypothetical protein
MVAMDIGFLNNFVSAAACAAVFKQILRQQKHNIKQHRMRNRISGKIYHDGNPRSPELWK